MRGTARISTAGTVWRHGDGFGGLETMNVGYLFALTVTGFSSIAYALLVARFFYLWRWARLLAWKKSELILVYGLGISTALAAICSGALFVELVAEILGYI
jgi:hypothetical protein